MFAPKVHEYTADKRSAAAWQIEQAINALEDGNYIIAVTLAGAAEGMLPDNGQGLHRNFMERLERDQWTARLDGGDVTLTRQEWNALYNRTRDWLKHVTAGDAGEHHFDIQEPAYMIARAISKLDDWTPRMIEFKDWFMAEIIGAPAEPAKGAA